MYLKCAVEGPKNLEIKWFYAANLQTNTENTSLPLQNSSDYFIQTVHGLSMTRTICRLRVKTVRAGYYWCRAYQNNVPLWPVSQKMDLSDQESYSRFNDCGASVQSVTVNKCHHVHMESITSSSEGPPGVLASSTQPLINAPSTSSWQTTTTTPATNNIDSPRMTSTTNMQLQPTSSNLQRPTSSSIQRPIPSSPGLGGLTGVPDDYEVWLFVVVGLTALFAVLIVALSIICIGLCVLKSRASKRGLCV